MMCKFNDKSARERIVFVLLTLNDGGKAADKASYTHTPDYLSFSGFATSVKYQSLRIQI